MCRKGKDISKSQAGKKWGLKDLVLLNADASKPLVIILFLVGNKFLNFISITKKWSLRELLLVLS